MRVRNFLNILKLTNIEPESGWLEDNPFLFGEFRLFSGAFAVRFREGTLFYPVHF